MSWSTLAGNQFVCFNDMSESGIPLNSGQSHTYTQKFITKAEVIAKYNVNTSYLASFTSTQWIPKSALTTGVIAYYWCMGYSTTAASLACSDAAEGCTSL